MAQVKFKRGHSNAIAQAGIQDGQILLDVDKGELYTDFGENNRIKVTDTTKADKIDTYTKSEINAKIEEIDERSDVVDVVGAYADLETYDTSKLTNEDIIKVLQDNTHNNAITYYKWVIGQQTHTGSWSYVGQSGPYYTKSETQEYVSEATANFITNTVNNLTNYYLKSETYDRTEVNNLIRAIQTAHFEIVNILPPIGESNVIYLILRSDPETSNIYDEYIYINNAYEKIGSTDIDLTGYATESWVNQQIANFLTQSQIQSLINTALTNYYTKTETDTLLEDKADTNGIYDEMIVGNAQNLVSTKKINNITPYNFRTSGGSLDIKSGIGNLEENAIIGGTICWNQKMNIPYNQTMIRTYMCNKSLKSIYTEAPIFIVDKFYRAEQPPLDTASDYLVHEEPVDWSTTYKNYYEYSGINITYTADHRVQIQGTAIYELSANNIGYFLNTHPISVPKNHVCFILTDGIPLWVNNSYRIMDSNEGMWSSSAIGGIYKKSNTSRLLVGLSVSQGTTLDLTFRLMWFDLTLMFGSEIANYLNTNYGQSSEGQFFATSWFKNLFPNDYYPYDNKPLNEGTLLSVKTSAHVMIGFNAYNYATGTAKLLGNKKYQITGTYTALYFEGTSVTLDSNNYYTPSTTGTLTIEGGNNTDTCVHFVWDGERDNEYEEYKEYNYPLASDLELKGIPKLDANNKLYYDGDEYKSDGTVTRKYGIRAYESGDENLTDVITDKTNTIYPLDTPTTEQVTPYTNPQYVNDWGTEEYIDNRTIAIPVGHNTKYTVNLKAKLEMAPNSPNQGNGDYLVRQIDGVNEYVKYTAPVVDQTFDFTSAKAQSGKAVAEALMGIDSVGQKTTEGGEIFNDYDHNKALGDNSTASGSNNVAGGYGYNYRAIDLVNKKIYLTATKVTDVNTIAFGEGVGYAETLNTGYAVGDKFSLVNDAHFDLCGTITQINGNEITYSQEAGKEFTFSSIAADSGQAGYSFYVPSKPTVGTILLFDSSEVSGTSNKSVGRASHSEGRGNLSAGDYAHTEGRENTAVYASHAEGFKTKATGQKAHAEGIQTVADNNAAHAEGYESKATGPYSHAEGTRNEASGENSHAQGNKTKASGSNSSTEGYQCYAEGPDTHAEGYQTKAIGDWSHTNGVYSVAKGQYTVVGGMGNIAGYIGQVVYGRYNDNKWNTILEIGNGEENYYEVTTDTKPQSGTVYYIKNSFNRYERMYNLSRFEDGVTYYVTSVKRNKNAFEVYMDGHAEVQVQGNTDKSIVQKQYVDALLARIEKLETAVVALGGTLN